MKQLITITIVCTLLSCTDNRSELITRIKQQKDSLSVFEARANGFDTASNHLLFDKRLTKDDSIFFEREKYNPMISKKTIDSLHIVWKLRSMVAQQILDSLENELKE